MAGGVTPSSRSRMTPPPVAVVTPSTMMPNKSRSFSMATRPPKWQRQQRPPPRCKTEGLTKYPCFCTSPLRRAFCTPPRPWAVYLPAWRASSRVKRGRALLPAPFSARFPDMILFLSAPAPFQLAPGGENLHGLARRLPPADKPASPGGLFRPLFPAAAGTGAAFADGFSCRLCSAAFLTGRA